MERSPFPWVEVVPPTLEVAQEAREISFFLIACNRLLQTQATSLKTETSNWGDIIERYLIINDGMPLYVALLFEHSCMHCLSARLILLPMHVNYGVVYIHCEFHVCLHCFPLGTYMCLCACMCRWHGYMWCANVRMHLQTACACMQLFSGWKAWIQILPCHSSQFSVPLCTRLGFFSGRCLTNQIIRSLKKSSFVNAQFLDVPMFMSWTVQCLLFYLWSWVSSTKSHFWISDLSVHQRFCPINCKEISRAKYSFM